MKYIFEQIEVNGYIIDVNGAVVEWEGQFIVDSFDLHITKNGFEISQQDFEGDERLYDLFINALESTELEHQQYLSDIYYGY